MSEVRREKIIELVEAARAGMLPAAGDSNAAEVLSAYFTLTRDGIEYVLKRRQSVYDREHNREAILRMLLELFELVNREGN